MESFYIVIYGIIGFILGSIYEDFKLFKQRNPGTGFKEYLLWKGWF